MWILDTKKRKLEVGGMWRRRVLVLGFGSSQAPRSLQALLFSFIFCKEEEGASSQSLTTNITSIAIKRASERERVN